MSYELPPSNSVADSDPSLPPVPAQNAQWAPPEKTGSPSRTSAFVALFLIAVVGGAALFFSGFMLGRLNGQTPGTSDANQELFRPFWDAYNDVSTNYVGTIDPHLLVEGAIKGIFNAAWRPLLVVPDRGGVPGKPDGHLGRVRGHRRRDGRARGRGAVHHDQRHLPADGQARHPGITGTSRRPARRRRAAGRRRQQHHRFKTSDEVVPRSAVPRARRSCSAFRATASRRRMCRSCATSSRRRRPQRGACRRQGRLPQDHRLQLRLGCGPRTSSCAN